MQETAAFSMSLHACRDLKTGSGVRVHRTSNKHIPDALNVQLDTFINLDIAIT